VSSWQRGKVVVVSSKNKEIHLMIKGRFNINRAVDGDVVAVEEIHTPTSTSSNDDGDDDDNVAVLPTSGAEAMEERVLEEESTTPEGGIIEKEGRVVGIIKRNWREYAGTLRPIQQEEEEQQQQGAGGDKQHGGGMVGYSKIERIFIPANPRIPNIRIVTKHSNDLDNMRICVVMDTWDRTSRLPQGHWSRILGRCGERDTESSVILHEHNVITRDFSDDVMRCLPPKDFQPDEEEISRRLDLRNVTVCSIDPPGCKDIDDALSCEVLDNGNWRIGVHIADVTHFVHPNTAIDKEAAERCTTVYLVERRTDMLPSLLTTDLCSLVGGKDRLCFSVLWEFQLNKKNGNEEVLKIVNTQFHKAIINSNAALSYAEAQARIDDKNDNSDLTQ
ncbi:mitotic control protein dis3, putative, partial [Perkinsus marinus ATCC 50983]